jgi:hypothetical protein
MKHLIQKFKELFQGKEYRFGAVYLSFLNQKTGNVFTQYVYGIKIYKSRKRMLEYLDRTVMTTMSQDIKLLDYSEVNK